VRSVLSVRCSVPSVQLARVVHGGVLLIIRRSWVRAPPAPPVLAAVIRLRQSLSSSPVVALTVARSAVETHLQSLYRKLVAASRTGAIERAVDLRLLRGR